MSGSSWADNSTFYVPRLNLVQRVRVGAGFVAASALSPAPSQAAGRLELTNQLRLDSTNMRRSFATQHLLGVL